MPLIDPADRRPVHFIGIAGAGMSALAELLARRGTVVTGCDAAPDGADDLARLGISVARGHDAGHVTGARAVVVTSAVPPGLPEVDRARALNIPVVRRAEALADAVSGGLLVAIAGTHGKTTTTVMTTEALAAAGRDPTGVVGGRVSAWGGNLRPGGHATYVVEADEYDRSFLALTPDVAVVTNVEADHLDIYADLADIRAAFERFVQPAKWVILCADDVGADTLRAPNSAEVVRYGTSAPGARLRAHEVRLSPRGAAFDVAFDGEHLGRLSLRVTGLHNVRNALAAVGAGIAAGVGLDAMAPGLEGFGGVERRFQHLGDAGGVAVIDDYAHHPTEIRATLDAARTAYPGRRLIAAFQPHLFTRTRDFASEFGEALSQADEIFLTAIYPAREQPIVGVTAGLVAAAAARAGRPVRWQGERGVLARALADEACDGDVVLTIGAGDITRTGPELLALLGQRATPAAGSAGMRRTAGRPT